MSLTGKQSPLGMNALASLLVNKGLVINPPTAARIGESKSVSEYTLGTLCNSTCLRLLTYSIRDAFVRGLVSGTTYDSLRSIGAGTIPALGNTKAESYTWTGYPNWNPYSGEIASWGYIRLFAAQAWNEFNYNSAQPDLKDFLLYFSTAAGFIDSSNDAIMAMSNAKTFLEGSFSNMNDLISSDITGVNPATVAFGQDMLATGKVIDLSSISTFGLPINLLLTLSRYNAVTDPVSVAIMTAGVSVSDLSALLDRSLQPTADYQRKVYTAFTTVVGQDLADILITLNCNTQELSSLADLLDPKKLFPNSYASLTVPVYNLIDDGTGSKIYYNIYDGAGVNSKLSSSQIKDQIGTQIVADAVESNEAATDISYEAPTGFGSYLAGILPEDIAIAAGAFNVSMMQIKNVSSVPIEKLAQVVSNIETIKGLDINGTTVPVNLDLINASLPLIALGSGIRGTYTMSDFLGCMSGLPYDWKSIQSKISALETATLVNLYREIYLATTWEDPVVNVDYTFDGSLYTVTGVTLAPPASGAVSLPLGWGGGGYSGSTPTVSSNCGSGSVQMGTDPLDTTYGRVKLTFTIGAPQAVLPTVTIASPPGAGWPAMNGVIQGLVASANAEIQNIALQHPRLAYELNELWSASGTQLSIEQRAIFTGIFLPVPLGTTPVVPKMAMYPLSQYGFVDSIPGYAANTKPHMYAQTLEAISDLSLPGGQSIIGQMREARNKLRLSPAGIQLDNSIDTTPSYSEENTLIASGVVSVGDPLPFHITTPEATLEQQIIVDGVTALVAPSSLGSYDPTTGVFSDQNGPIKTGEATEPGSFAGSPYQALIPTNLNVLYTSGTLLPAILTTAEAIDDTVLCNCDSWVI